MSSNVAALIADDLTGACDAAVHFAAAGLETQVSLDGRRPDAEVVAFTTDSRDVDEALIRSRIADVARTLTGSFPGVLFKKIDSVLRGRPGLEIAVAMEAFGCEVAVVTPAYPEMGRVVAGGWLTASSLREKLDVAAMLRADSLDTSRCVVMDAGSDEDLAGIVQRYWGDKQRVLWCGSGGLAMALAGHMGLAEHMEKTQPAAMPPAAGPVAFCIGSDHPATMAQEVSLLAAGGVSLFDADTEEDVAAALTQGRHALLRIHRDRTSPAQIRALLAGAHPAALFICGGDTAAMVLSALEATGITLRGELVRGVPWGTVRGGIMEGVPVVTKSGGFGAPDTLTRTTAFFQTPK